MVLKLEHWRVVSVEFTANNNDEADNSFDLKYGQNFPEEEEKLFEVVFNIELKDKRFSLALEMFFTFSSDEKITEEFKISLFPKVNAPAIAFPYLRSFISNFTLQAGYDPIILPSLNFVEMNKEG